MSEPHTIAGALIGGDGTCFDDAFDDLLAHDSEATLVHGQPVWAAGDGTQRMWHAWTETVENIGGFQVRMCHDQRSPLGPLPADLYYRVGRLDSEHVTRYDKWNAMRMAVENGTSGPWL